MTPCTPAILFDKPEAKYYPGDTVTGTVIIDNAKPMSARSVIITWRGVCQVTTGLLRSTFQDKLFFGRDMAWVSKDKENKLPAGPHKFPFSFTLPLCCSPSHNGFNTKNEYKVEVDIDRVWSFHTNVEKKFVVTKKLDCDPYTYEFNNIINRKSFFSDGPVTLQVTVTDLCQPGQTIDIEYKVTNNSSTKVSHLVAFLVRKVHYHNRPQHTPCEHIRAVCPLSSGQRGRNYTLLQFVRVRVDIPPYSEGTKIVKFTIPKTAKTPNFANGLMTYGYNMFVGCEARNSFISYGRHFEMWIGEEQGTTVEEKQQEAIGTTPPPPFKA